MKPRLLGLAHEASTAESVYADKYEWLMRWALHFCSGDKEMAEDLVQDTFVRMLSSWHSIRDIENPERFLYTYLKYGFLRLKSADNKKAIQAVSVHELDLLDYQPPDEGAELMEWQRSIRSIVNFLCWRKATTKSASLLLLRFFHGLFPVELMRVARLTRKAVDDGLASARQEARSSCAGGHPWLSSGVITRPSRPAPFLVVPNADSQMSTDEFMRQMLSTIFAAPSGDCLPARALRDRYDPRSNAPIDCWLLSHIVSCQRCLDLVLELLSLPPRGTRPLEDILGYAPKSEGSKTKRKAPVSAAMRSMNAARERYREVIEHRPRSITLVVDGQSLASRDVSGVQSQLTVDLRGSSVPDLIEVIGDSHLLIAFPLLVSPPDSSPVQHCLAELSEGRSVALTLEFTAQGMRIHVAYIDPLLADAPAQLFVPSGPWRSAVAENAQGDPEGMIELSVAWLKKIFRPWLRLSLAFTCAGLIIAHSFVYPSRPAPATVLARAVEVTRQATTGVATQRVRISTNGPHTHTSYEATLHRDLGHRLTARHMQESATMAATEAELASAKIAWSDPLSPVNFREWREQQQDATDSVIEKHEGYLTLTSTVDSGLVREQTLTVSATTFHAVGRTVRFRDNEEVEIAELEYSVVPFAKSDPAWFESPLPEGGKSLTPVTPHAKAATLNLSAEQLDIAELNVRLALVELQADGRERLSISRQPDAVFVQGIVATDERRRAIERRLRQAANVQSAIRTFEEADASQNQRPIASSPESPVLTVVSASDRDSPLETLSQERRFSNEKLGALHAALLDSAVELRQSAMGMREVETRLGRNQLDADGATLRSSLIEHYAARMKAATEKETRTLSEFSASISDSPAQVDGSLWDAALKNSQLCFELISPQADGPRSAETILRELVASAHAMKESLQNAHPAS